MSLENYLSIEEVDNGSHPVALTRRTISVYLFISGNIWFLAAMADVQTDICCHGRLIICHLTLGIGYSLTPICGHVANGAIFP